MKNFKETITEQVSNNFEISDEWQRKFHNHVQSEYGLNMIIEYAINTEKSRCNIIIR